MSGNTNYNVVTVLIILGASLVIKYMLSPWSVLSRSKLPLPDVFISSSKKLDDCSLCLFECSKYISVHRASAKANEDDSVEASLTSRIG